MPQGPPLAERAPPQEFIREPDTPDQGPGFLGLRLQLESPEGRRKAKQSLNNGIEFAVHSMDTLAGILVTISKVTNTPFLQGSAGLVVTMIEIVMTMKANQAKFLSLARRSGEIISIIHEEIQGKGRQITQDLMLKLEGLHNQLVDICIFVRKAAGKSAFRRAMKRKPDQDAIYEYERRLDQALNEFQFKTQLGNTVLLQAIADKILDASEEDAQKQEQERKDMVTATEAQMEEIEVEREKLEQARAAFEEQKENERRAIEVENKLARDKRDREQAEWEAKKAAEEFVARQKKAREAQDQLLAESAEAEKKRREKEQWEAEKRKAVEKAELDRKKLEEENREAQLKMEREARMHQQNLAKKQKDIEAAKAHMELLAKGQQAWLNWQRSEEDEKRHKKREEEATRRQEEERYRREEAERLRRRPEEQLNATFSGLHLSDYEPRPQRHSWNVSSQPNSTPFSPPKSPQRKDPNKNPFLRPEVYKTQSDDSYLGVDDPYQKSARRSYDSLPVSTPYSPPPPYGGNYNYNSGNVVTSNVTNSFNETHIIRRPKSRR